MHYVELLVPTAAGLHALAVPFARTLVLPKLTLCILNTWKEKAAHRSSGQSIDGQVLPPDNLCILLRSVSSEEVSSLYSWLPFHVQEAGCFKAKILSRMLKLQVSCSS